MTDFIDHSLPRGTRELLPHEGVLFGDRWFNRLTGEIDPLYPQRVWEVPGGLPSEVTPDRLQELKAQAVPRNLTYGEHKELAAPVRGPEWIGIREITGPTAY